jgi:hypothetical protein
MAKILQNTINTSPTSYSSGMPKLRPATKISNLSKGKLKSISSPILELNTA